jgi:outer membrane protein TolC
MRTVLLTALAGLISSASVAAEVMVTLPEVTQKVSQENFLILENANRVYQAKESVTFARMSLLPKLNIWKLAEFAYDPRSAVGLIEDIAPFLVPANWFKVQEQKHLYRAQREAYHALWANEIMTARNLYLQILHDQSLFDHVKLQKAGLEDVLEIVRARESLGGEDPSISKEIQVRVLSLLEDQRGLEVLIAEEKNLLSFVMGYKAEDSVSPSSVPFLNFSRLKPVDWSILSATAVERSPEVRQFHELLLAADKVKKSVYFSFLGASSMSQGVAGGIFDGVPVQNGLGFGLGASIKIAKSQKEILKLQANGVQETLKRHLKLVAAAYNLDLQHYANLKQRVDLASEILAQLQDRIRLGDSIPSLKLLEASRNQIQANTEFFGVQFRMLMNQERLARLMLQDAYSGKPPHLEKISEK